MNDQVLTLGDIALLVTILGGVGALWYRVETRVSQPAKDAAARAELALSQLASFKLEVAENYAKNGFIRDVEERLGKQLDAIVQELHGMRRDVQDALVKAMTKNTTEPQ